MLGFLNFFLHERHLETPMPYNEICELMDLADGLFLHERHLETPMPYNEICELMNFFT